VALSCILRHSAAFHGTRLHSKEPNLDSDRLVMQGTYESANRQCTLTAWIEGCTKTLSDTKITEKSICIVFSKATRFTYEIGNLDQLTQILFIIKYITANTIFPILYTENVMNYNALSTYFYIGFRF
jgi:hypothetical protein